MAGIIKRSNKWVAVFKTLDGKEVRKTTRIDVVPKVIPPGANKRAVIAQNEARARLIAEELEHGHKTGFVDSQRLKAIAGGDVQAASLGRKAVSVGAYLHEWLQSRSGKIQAHERDGKAIKLSLEFTGLLKKHGIISAGERKGKGDKRVLSEKSFHSLRATAVTILRLAGVPADLCRFIVGHDSEEIERVYFRPDSQDVVHAIEEISSKIVL